MERCVKLIEREKERERIEEIVAKNQRDSRLLKDTLYSETIIYFKFEKL